MNDTENSQRLEILMQQAQMGDKRAYTNLLTQSSALVQKFLSKKLSNSDDIQDILQEILISIHKARHTYDASRPFKPWLFAIAGFRLNDFFRKSYRKAHHDSVIVEQTKQENELQNVTETNLLAEEMKKALELLPEKQKAIVTMMKLEGYSAQEVADHLGMSVSAVKVAAHRVYKKLGNHKIES